MNLDGGAYALTLFLVGQVIKILFLTDRLFSGGCYWHGAIFWGRRQVKPGESTTLVDICCETRMTGLVLKRMTVTPTETAP